MFEEHEQEFAMIAQVRSLEEEGHCFANVTDEQIRQVFDAGRDLRELTIPRAA